MLHVPRRALPFFFLFIVACTEANRMTPVCTSNCDLGVTMVPDGATSPDAAGPTGPIPPTITLCPAAAGRRLPRRAPVK